MAKAPKMNIEFLKKRNPLADPAKVKPIGASGDGMIEQVYKTSANESLPLLAIKPAPDTWNFFMDASPEVLDKLARSIAEYGLLNPITVWEQDAGSYMILSGHTRYRAFQLLQEAYREAYPMEECPYDKIPCKVFKAGEISQEDARFIIILANTAQRALESKRDRIIAVCEMMRLAAQVPKRERGEKGRVGDLIAKKLNLNPNTVYTYKNIGLLIPELFDLTMKGKITLHIGSKLGKLAREVQQVIAENKLYKKIPAGEQNATRFINELDGKTVAETVEIFDNILEPVKDVIVKTKVAFKVPKGCGSFGIIVPEAELDKVRAFLRQAVASYPNQEVRELLEKSLR